jgi:FKBP-type peptidyl-prolyl cis-trans isomerase
MVSVARNLLRPFNRRSPAPGWTGITLGILGMAALSSAALAGQAPVDPAAQFLATNRASDKAIVETASGLQYKVLTPGAGGATPTDQDVALVNYEGKLTNGTVFDKSQEPTPMPVTRVVPGFSEALKLMPKGAKYRFWIKPSLAYGDEASGPIPPHSVLVFDVELVDFLPESVVRQMLQEHNAQGASPQPDAPPAP